MATKEAPKKGKRPTAQKRMLQNEKRRLINKTFKTRVRSAMREFEESLTSNDPAVIEEKLNNVYSFMDKGVKRNIFTSNKASRTKARATAKASKS